MLSNILREKLPEGFRFRDTGWYQAIAGIHEQFLRRLLLTGLSAAAIAAFVYLFLDLRRGNTAYLVYYGIWLAASLGLLLSLIHISEPTRLLSISYAVFCLKKKTTNHRHKLPQSYHHD